MGTPWQVWVYYGIGLVIAYWYQGREGHAEREHWWRTQLFLLIVLAMMWPVLLLAMAVNRPDGVKGKGAGKGTNRGPSIQKLDVDSVGEQEDGK